MREATASLRARPAPLAPGTSPPTSAACTESTSSGWDAIQSPRLAIANGWKSASTSTPRLQAREPSKPLPAASPGHRGSQGNGASACVVLRLRYPVHGHAEAAVPDASDAVRNRDTNLVGPRPADLRPPGRRAADGLRTCSPDPATGRYRPPKSPRRSRAGTRPPARGTRPENHVSTGLT